MKYESRLGIISILYDMYISVSYSCIKMKTYSRDNFLKTFAETCFQHYETLTQTFEYFLCVTIVTIFPKH